MGERVLRFVEGVKSMKRRTLYNLFKGAAMTDFPPMEEISSIQAPALILGWKGDPTHPVETAIELDKLMPQSSLVVAENYADFEEWPQLIRDFVKRT